MIIDEATNLGFSLWQILHQGILYLAYLAQQLAPTSYKACRTQWREVRLEIVDLLRTFIHSDFCALLSAIFSIGKKV